MANNMQLVLLFFCGFVFALNSSQTIHKMAVRSDIRFRFATTEMTCVMTNDRDTASELTFDVTLPKDAFITNFTMEINGKDYLGNVKQKQEARKEYLYARRSGSSGGLVEQSARHSNKFDVSVNIAAGSNVTFTLIYQELLRRQFGKYEYSVYIDGKTLAEIQDYSIEIYIQDRNEIRDVRTPEMRKEVMSNAVEEVAVQNTLTQITTPTATSVYVVYRPSPGELREKGSGWFMVQYDVDSDSAGELLVVDGYFVHFFVPPDDLPPLPLDIVFVLDISGSMAGRKLAQLKDAMRIILDDLRETDRFSILLFDGNVKKWETSLQEASESNVERAQTYVRAIQHRGSTNLHLALMTGLEMLQGSREAARVPMIFFLTDGEATSGEQDSKKIVADVSQKNEGTTNIYSLAFGSGADYKLLRQISAKNNGFARKIYEASDASEQVLGLYREISTIVMRSLTVSYHSTSNNDDGEDNKLEVDNSTITICDLSILFGKSDFVVAGKLQNVEKMKMAPEKAGGLRLSVSGQGAKEKVNFILEEDDLSQLILTGNNPFWTIPRDLSKMAERTWAFLTIKQLLEKKLAAAENPSLVEELEKQILDLSLKYHFVTPLTSMVVTRPEDGLKKDKLVEASFRADDDMPASQGRRGSQLSSLPVAASHSQGGFQNMYSQVMKPDSLQHYPMKFPLQATFAPQTMTFPPWATDMAAPGKKTIAGSAWMFHSGSGAASHDHVSQSLGPKSGISGASRAHNRRKHRGKKRKLTAHSGKGKRRGKGRQRLRKAKKACIRNKRVILQLVLAHGQQMPVTCYELRAGRKQVQNYTLLADPTTKFSVMVAMKKRNLLGLYMQHNSNVTVKVNAHGDLTFTPQSVHSNPMPANSSVLITPDKQSLELHHGNITIIVKITKKTCKVTFIAVSVNIGASGADPVVARRYTGVAVKNYQVSHKKSKKRKARMRKASKICMANRIPADKSMVVKGKHLLQYKA